MMRICWIKQNIHGKIPARNLKIPCGYCFAKTYLLSLRRLNIKNHSIFQFAVKQYSDSFIYYLSIEKYTISFHQNVKQGKDGEVKGKGIAKGEPIGEGETPCFALGFVVSPAHIGSPFAGELQNYKGHKSS